MIKNTLFDSKAVFINFNSEGLQDKQQSVRMEVKNFQNNQGDKMNLLIKVKI